MSLLEHDSHRESARERLKGRLERRGYSLPEQAVEDTDAPETKLTASQIFTGILETYGFKFIVVLAAVVLALAFFVGSGLRSCANTQAINTSQTAGTNTQNTHATQQSASNTQAASTTQQTDTTPQDTDASYINELELRLQQRLEEAKAELEQANLTSLLGEDLVDQMSVLAKANKDIAWIQTHPSEYAVDGWAVQYKILKLAAEEPFAATYVRNWPTLYPANDQDSRSAHALKTTATGPAKIPQLFQWDPRWGYTVYSSTAFGMTGCCPTTLAMVYQGLTGKTDKSPYDMGLLAQEGGYMSLYEGTDANFLVNEAPGLGLNCWVLADETWALTNALESGQIVIANVGPGDFTTDGHFIVVTGLQDGKLIVNDPYSKVRSNKLWEADEIVAQSKALFAYSKA